MALSGGKNNNKERADYKNEKIIYSQDLKINLTFSYLKHFFYCTFDLIFECIVSNILLCIEDCFITGMEFCTVEVYIHKRPQHFTDIHAGSDLDWEILKNANTYLYRVDLLEIKIPMLKAEIHAIDIYQ